MTTGFPNASVVKNQPANAADTEDVGSIPASRRSPGGGNGNKYAGINPWREETGRLQSMRLRKNRTQLSTHTCT